MKNLLTTLALAALVALSALTPQTARAQATIYNQPVDPIAQLAGGPGAPVVKPTYAATITLNPAAGLVRQIAGSNTTSAACTLSVANAGQFGQLLIVICSADSSGTVTYTFSSSAANFKATGTAVCTLSTSISVLFVSDGTVWREVARSASAQ